jgi:RNA polymerase-binding transcription factor
LPRMRLDLVQDCHLRQVLNPSRNATPDGVVRHRRPVAPRNGVGRLRYRRAVEADRARELLAAERTRIERALARLGHADDSEPADEYDPANLASDLYQDEFDSGLADDLREQLAGVVRAEERLAAGTYGLSIESGQPIPDERLEALPTAELTADEERARE